MSPVAKQKFNDVTIWILRITVGGFATLFSIVTVIVGVIASEMRADLKIIMNERSGVILQQRQMQKDIDDNKLNITDLYNQLNNHRYNNHGTTNH